VGWARFYFETVEAEVSGIDARMHRVLGHDEAKRAPD
jgi:hypothetical protein